MVRIDIGNILRREIEAHAARVISDNPFLRCAREGEISPDTMGRYLASLHFAIARVPELLERARERALATAQGALAEYFAEKHREEEGHHRWAESDLRVLCASFDVRDLRVAPAIEELVGFQVEIIDEDPILYLAYVFWAEAFTTLAAGELVRALVERCGVPSTALTCLARHVDLDRAHSDDDLRVLNELAGDAGLLPRMLGVLDRTMALFDRMCEQVLDVAAPARRWAGASA